jgi:PAS domain-containing protein
MRWKQVSDDSAPIEGGVPDALAVFNPDGELIGWDESAAHIYGWESALPGRCDGDCAARGHVEAW